MKCACGCGEDVPARRKMFATKKCGDRVRQRRRWQKTRVSRSVMRSTKCLVCGLGVFRHGRSKTRYHEWCEPTAKRVRDAVNSLRREAEQRESD